MEDFHNPSIVVPYPAIPFITIRIIDLKKISYLVNRKEKHCLRLFPSKSTQYTIVTRTQNIQIDVTVHEKILRDEKIFFIGINLLV